MSRKLTLGDSKTVDNTFSKAFRTDFEKEVEEAKWKWALEKIGKNREKARRLLQIGAESFGFWPELSDRCLDGLLETLLSDNGPPAESRGLREWKEKVKKFKFQPVSSKAQHRGPRGRCSCFSPPTLPKYAPEESGEYQTFGDGATTWILKRIMLAVVIILSVIYAVFVVNYQYARGGDVEMLWVWKQGHPAMIAKDAVETHRDRSLEPLDESAPPNLGDIADAESAAMPNGSMTQSHNYEMMITDDPYVYQVFGWPVYIARGAAMAASLLTSVLYVTMSKGFGKCLKRRFLKRRRCCGSLWLSVLDAHKELHVFAGKWVAVFSGLHILAHMVASSPAVVLWTTIDREFLNSFLGCANRDAKFGPLANASRAFEAMLGPFADACPLEEPMNINPLAFYRTTTGISGMLLTFVIGAAAWTGRKAYRSKNFDRFFYIHVITIYVWPVLGIVHGATQRLGVGIPLILVTSGLPMLMVIWDAIYRLIQFQCQVPCCFFCCYCCRRRTSNIVRAVTRPGPNDRASYKGAMIQLQVSPPPCWKWQPGMYAFICMPAYAPLQWHPFTICSGSTDETVDFLIDGVGDWTQALADYCLRAAEGEGTTPLPRVALNGPFPAPAQSAMTKRILVCIGAGVGITPFLSLLATFIAVLIDHDPYNDPPLKEAHIFWSTRSADEFLFAAKLFKYIDENHEEVGTKVFLHLHCTANTPSRDACAYLFREAVRRQSIVDRKGFETFMAEGNAGVALRQRAGWSSYVRGIVGSSLPWCWVGGLNHDVIWVNIADGVTRRPSRAKEFRSGSTKILSEDTPGGDGDATKLIDEEAAEELQSEGPLVPVAFGRPDWEKELRSVGSSWDAEDVNIYICGSMTIVKNVQEVCEKLNNERFDEGNPTAFKVFFERFG